MDTYCGTGGTSTATVTVSTSPNTPNRAVTLSADAVLSSGGHVDHTGARPTGSFAPASGNTNGSGIFQATYTAPIFGGTMNIKAQMRAQIKSTTLQIYVPGLFDLGGNGTNYLLVGQLNWHPSNHYGTLTAVTNLPLIADDYKAQFYGQNAIPAADKLNYNDMSLINGGKFDINPDRTVPPNWTNNSHAEHREGKNCDVYSGNVPTSRWGFLTGRFVVRGSQDYLDETATSNHWHLRFTQ